MDIEAPASTSVPQEFIWRLPLSVRGPTSYVTHFESSAPDEDQVPQTNTATVLYRFHYRYQPVQEGRSLVPVTFPDPAVFIDCANKHLALYSWTKDNPIINLLNDQNRPSNREGLTQWIAAGRLEDRSEVLVLTLGLTIAGMVVVA